MYDTSFVFACHVYAQYKSFRINELTQGQILIDVKALNCTQRQGVEVKIRYVRRKVLGVVPTIAAMLGTLQVVGSAIGRPRAFSVRFLYRSSETACEA